MRERILELIQIADKDSYSTPIYIRIADKIKELITSGELKADEQLPPVRILANKLKVSVTTVLKAYYELEKEGYIDIVRTEGCYVSKRIPIPVFNEPKDLNARNAWLEHGIAVLEKAAINLIRQTTLEAEKSADVIVLDTETTGLTEEDELLQVSIISDSGETLYNSYLRPLHHFEWKEAQAVNHISPEMVIEAPTIFEEMPKINAILRNAKQVIGYNTYFDLNFLYVSGGIHIPPDNVVDVMELFAPIYGEWIEEFDSYKWQKLTTCAEYYNYYWGNDTAHDSLADCQATLHCYKAIMAAQKELEAPFD